jgi:hypothetical protein
MWNVNRLALVCMVMLVHMLRLQPLLKLVQKLFFKAGWKWRPVKAARLLQSCLLLLPQTFLLRLLLRAKARYEAYCCLPNRIGHFLLK